MGEAKGIAIPDIKLDYRPRLKKYQDIASKHAWDQWNSIEHMEKST